MKPPSEYFENGGAILLFHRTASSNKTRRVRRRSIRDTRVQGNTSCIVDVPTSESGRTVTPERQLCKGFDAGLMTKRTFRRRCVLGTLFLLKSKAIFDAIYLNK